ncbi:ClpP/crotonase [Gautieria morchelliformis]|nr:ClpP/crotonase [Gautieria morchelliformis]
MAYPVFLPSSDERLLTLTHPLPHLWQVELHNGPDSRLTSHLLRNAFLPALDRVELEWRSAWKAAQEKGDVEAGKGAVVITGNLKQNKFFSNGLDLKAAMAETGFFLNTFHPFLVRLVTFPIPLVAAINGHAFAGGWILGTACDYRVMSSGKCWASMNEVHLGSDFPHAIMIFLRSKFRNPVVLRKMLLEGHRWTPQELLAQRLVDELVEGGSAAVLERALAVADKRSSDAKTGYYGLIKKGINRDVLEAARLDPRLISAKEDHEVFNARL